MSMAQFEKCNDAPAHAEEVSVSSRGYGNAQIFQRGLFINNEFVFPKSCRETIRACNPYTGNLIAEVSCAGWEDIEYATKSAKNASKKWSSTSFEDRAMLINKLAELMIKNIHELALIESLNSGKPIKTSTEDIEAAASTLRYYAGWADKLYGEIYSREGMRSWTIWKPYGIVALILPWNYPLLILAWKLGPTLITGNCVIIKTSELTPLSALKLSELILEAGFPSGVINVVSGSKDVGKALCCNINIDKISFTGSPETGVLVSAACASPYPKPLLLELGGKGFGIVFADADLINATKNTLSGAFDNMGQNCCACSVVYVHNDVYYRFVAMIKEGMSAFVLGDPLSKNTTFGPVISEQHAVNLAKYVSNAVEQKAVVYTPLFMDQPWSKAFFPPTLLENVPPLHPLVTKEVFGPILSLVKFEDAASIIETCSRSTFGLACGVYTRNSSISQLAINELKVGTLWINTYNDVLPHLPFGGFKMSGYGKDLGRRALTEYAVEQTIIERIPAL